MIIAKIIEWYIIIGIALTIIAIMIYGGAKGIDGLKKLFAKYPKETVLNDFAYMILAWPKVLCMMVLCVIIEIKELRRTDNKKSSE